MVGVRRIQQVDDKIVAFAAIHLVEAGVAID